MTKVREVGVDTWSSCGFTSSDSVWNPSATIELIWVVILHSLLCLALCWLLVRLKCVLKRAACLIPKAGINVLNWRARVFFGSQRAVCSVGRKLSRTPLRALSKELSAGCQLVRGGAGKVEAQAAAPGMNRSGRTTSEGNWKVTKRTLPELSELKAL